jgi:HK97 gp10 family phage protein
MSFVSIDLSEVHALASDIQRNADQVEPKARTLVAAGGHRTLAVMQAKTPVDTGNLKSSESVDIDGLSFEAGPTADYAEYVELGTSRMAAEPYAGPAFDEVEPQIADALGDLGAQILGRA